jgi:hypothetical protein
MMSEKSIDAQLVKKYAYSSLPFDSGFLPHSYKLATRQYAGLGDSNQNLHFISCIIYFNTLLSLFLGIQAGLPSDSPYVLHFPPISSPLI